MKTLTRERRYVVLAYRNRRQRCGARRCTEQVDAAWTWGLSWLSPLLHYSLILSTSLDVTLWTRAN